MTSARVRATRAAADGAQKSSTGSAASASPGADDVDAEVASPEMTTTSDAHAALSPTHAAAAREVMSRARASAATASAAAGGIDSDAPLVRT